MITKFLGGYCKFPASKNQKINEMSILDGIIDISEKKLYLLDVVQYGSALLHDCPVFTE